MRIALSLLMPAALLAACSGPAPAPAPKPAVLAVSDARVTLSPVPGRPAAAYLTIRGGRTDDRLVGLASARVATVELHEGGMRNGMMTMGRVAGIDVPAGSEVSLAPGGFHAMLFGVDPAVQPGGSLPLRLSFASGSAMETRAEVRAAGDPDGRAH